MKIICLEDIDKSFIVFFVVVVVVIGECSDRNNITQIWIRCVLICHFPYQDGYRCPEKPLAFLRGWLWSWKLKYTSFEITILHSEMIFFKYSFTKQDKTKQRNRNQRNIVKIRKKLSKNRTKREEKYVTALSEFTNDCGIHR